MKTIAIALLSGVSLLASAAMAEDNNGNSANAPGHDRSCLVTTSGGASGTVTGTKWLPTKAAEAQADNKTTFVGTNAAVQTQEGCESFPTSGGTSASGNGGGGNGQGNPHQNGQSGNPAAGNPGNDKPVGNAGENPSKK